MASRRKLVVVLALVVSAAGPPVSTALAVSCTPPVNIVPALEPLISGAVADLAQRLGVAVAQVCVVEARAVVWPDRSLGCPKAGMLYPQVLQDGVYIRLSVDGRFHHYHGGGSRAPFLCEATDRQAPLPAGAAGPGSAR